MTPKFWACANSWITQLRQFLILHKIFSSSFQPWSLCFFVTKPSQFSSYLSDHLPSVSNKGLLFPFLFLNSLPLDLLMLHQGLQTQKPTVPRQWTQRSEPRGERLWRTGVHGPYSALIDFCQPAIFPSDNQIRPFLKTNQYTGTWNLSNFKCWSLIQILLNFFLDQTKCICRPDEACKLQLCLLDGYLPRMVIFVYFHVTITCKLITPKPISPPKPFKISYWSTQIPLRYPAGISNLTFKTELIIYPGPQT